jgi:MFS family permease
MISTRKKTTDPYGGLPPHLRQLEINPDMQKALKGGIITAAVATLGIAAFAVISFFAVPFVVTVLVNALFAGSAIYLAGLAYGILNDFIGVKKNLPYFTLGHQPTQKALIQSNDKTTIGIAWGIYATMGPSLIAAILFTVATVITGFIGLPFAAFVLPILAIAVPIALGAAHLYSKYKEKQLENKWRESPYDNELTNCLNVFKRPHLYDENLLNEFLNEYQRSRLGRWLKDENDMKAWFGNGARNSFGYIALPIVGVLGLAALITSSSISGLLPAVLFSAAFSVFPVIGLGILLAVAITAACVYLYVNRNKIVDNGYRLDPPEEKVEVPEPKKDSTDTVVARRLSEAEPKPDSALEMAAPAQAETVDADRPKTPVSLHFVPASRSRDVSDAPDSSQAQASSLNL